MRSPTRGAEKVRLSGRAGAVGGGAGRDRGSRHIRRQLARDRPAVFLPDLATALNNQALRLGDLGRPEEALAAIEEAVTIRRQLARDRPDAFLPNLAGSLNNQSVYLAKLGRREEALAATDEAAGVDRQLAQDRPAAFLPDLAGALNNQSGRLAELERWGRRWPRSRKPSLSAVSSPRTARRCSFPTWPGR